MIKPRPFATSPNYQTVVRAILRMHKYSIDGQEESEEAELLRESMSDLWESLSIVERERVTGLSKDLYEISDQPTHSLEPMNPQVQGKLNSAYEARERGEWDKALELLRRWGKYVPAPLISYLRGTIWRAAGDAVTAVVFFGAPAELDSGNVIFQSSLLETLGTANPTEAADRAEVILQNSDSKNPVFVLHARHIIFGSLRKMPDLAAMSGYRRLISVLEKSLERLESQRDLEYAIPLVDGFRLLATCYWKIGESQKSYQNFSRAIQLDPIDDLTLIARGILTYGTDRNAAADFEQAISLGSKLVWPHFYLAHHYLVNNRFEECRTICTRGLQWPSPKRIQSELHEFLAIASAHLGYPEHIVRRAFEDSMRADPSNDRVLRNLEAYDNALLANSPKLKDWENPSESSMRDFANAEYLWLSPASAGDAFINV